MALWWNQQIEPVERHTSYMIVRYICRRDAFAARPPTYSERTLRPRRARRAVGAKGILNTLGMYRIV